MYDATRLLSQFYNEKLRLGREGRIKLAGLRDTNLVRLKTGLEQLGPIQGSHKAGYERTIDQGSYAMHTLNQHPDGDYDIDTAVIFDPSVLPASPLEARKRVADALLQSSSGFIRDPEARTNAVTVWYAEGHHVDLAIYRETADGRLEHAGPEWTERDPSAVTDWFKQRVDELSPSMIRDVEPKQLRRIVRFVKRFCVSRRSWSLPGGMVTTSLVAETYVRDRWRDDVALRKTLNALSTRLASDERVASPIDATQELTGKPRTAGRVRRLKKRLDEVLPKLDVLDDSDCDEDAARSAWNTVFRHGFFTPARASKAERPASVKVVVGVAKRKGGPVRERLYRANEAPLPKGLWLRFEAKHNLQRDDVVRWIVQNQGDEAEAAGDLGHSKEGRQLVAWRATRYKGDHKMRCEIERGGRIIAVANRTVRVSQ